MIVVDKFRARGGHAPIRASALYIDDEGSGGLGRDAGVVEGNLATISGVCVPAMVAS